MTIITTTFIPCGAKLPIIALIGGAIVGGAWWVAPLIYFAGVGSVIVSGIMLKKTKLFAGDPAPFVMELPQYHMPQFKSMMLHVWERLKSFIIRAGTVIFASSIVVWFLLGFGVVDGSFGLVDSLVEEGIEAGVLDEDTAAIDYSIMADVGGVIAPAFKPLGFGDSWEPGVGVVTGLVAKENLVSTLAVIGSMSEATEEAAMEGEIDEHMGSFMTALLPSVAAGLSYLIFNMLCAPCFAAIGAIRRQMASGRWTAFAVLYQTGFAYLVSLMVYQFGTWFAGGGFGMGTAAALAALAGFLYMIFRPDPQKKNAALKGAGAEA